MASLFHERALAMSKLEKLEGQIKDLRRMIDDGASDSDIIEQLLEEHQAIDKLASMFRKHRCKDFLTHPHNCSCML